MANHSVVIAVLHPVTRRLPGGEREVLRAGETYWLDADEAAELCARTVPITERDEATGELVVLGEEPVAKLAPMPAGTPADVPAVAPPAAEFAADDSE